ncbi:hypothetical protein QH494_11675 [Sphingomonas sp. AR_OL41]|uniref:hypothetical protein n=1 Tax=Sphingomonas sp. AR_OL41 TaxID=3042729 RepID=UPI0024803E88|nr:hypothetical protein [Sphingomonas sp. AR_OL41]MDH7972845.1 hypothetical protein [Sphingomonas sp. AR_OL41]
MATTDRAALFCIDNSLHTRFEMLGKARVYEIGEAPTRAEALAVGPCHGVVERCVRVAIGAFDGNCPQHIIPQFSLPEIDLITAVLRRRIGQLERERARARDPDRGP